jgi:hypothetical protein
MTDDERAALVENVAGFIRQAIAHPWLGAEHAARGILAAIEPVIRADERARMVADLGEPVAWRYRYPMKGEGYKGYWNWSYTEYPDDPNDDRLQPLYAIRAALGDGP